MVNLWDLRNWIGEANWTQRQAANLAKRTWAMRYNRMWNDDVWTYDELDDLLFEMLLIRKAYGWAYYDDRRDYAIDDGDTENYSEGDTIDRDL